jgi:hypothetical protein
MKAEPGLHGVIGNTAKRVIEEMGKNVGKHDEAAGEPDLSNSDPAQPASDGRRFVCASTAHINDCWCLQGHADFRAPFAGLGKET